MSILAPGGYVLALDSSSAMVEVARTRVPDGRTTIRYAVRDALALQEPDESSTRPARSARSSGSVSRRER
jgi:ubiquinone/menaquinone biosynthesis C-methylase UbiE